MKKIILIIVVIAVLVYTGLIKINNKKVSSIARDGLQKSVSIVKQGIKIVEEASK